MPWDPPDRLDKITEKSPPPPLFSNRHVRMKPVQLVITARIEGSHGVAPKDLSPVFFRVCMKCLEQVRP